MKLCLIGSTRFKKLYGEANQRLTAQGHIVYTVAFDTSTAERTEISDDLKELLDLVHLRKILESDAVVLITDETGYFGDSTRREIKWAQILERDLFQYDPSEDSEGEFLSSFWPEWTALGKC